MWRGKGRAGAHPGQGNHLSRARLPDHPQMDSFYLALALQKIARQKYSESDLIQRENQIFWSVGPKIWRSLLRGGPGLCLI